MRTSFFILRRFCAVFCAALLFAACESSLDQDPSKLPLQDAMPPSIQITSRHEALLVQWTKIAAAQGVEPSYDVYFGDSAERARANKWARLPPPSSNLVKTTITGLENGKIYYVWVKSIFGGLGESGFSEAFSGIPVPPPALPDKLEITGDENMLEVTWEKVEFAFTYNVFYAAGTTTEKTPPQDAEALTVSEAGAVILELTNNVYYTVWVQAENTAGQSEFRRGTGRPTAATAPPTSAPAIDSFIPGDKKISLSWQAVKGAPEYTVYYNTSNTPPAQSAFTVPTSSPAVTTQITGLTNGTRYYVWVKSKNSIGESAAFSPVKEGTPAAKPPIDWSSSTFELGYAAAEYVFAADIPKSVFFPDGRPGTDRLTRIQETALGNLFADGAAWYAREVLKEPVDFAFINGGYIDIGLREGTVTTASIARIAKAYDCLVFLTLTGAQLKRFFGVMASDNPADLIPYSVAYVTHMGRGGHDTGEFGIVSKEVRYTIEYPKSPALGSVDLSAFDAGDPYWHGRIKAGTLKLNGADIDDGRTYRICTSDYNASGVYYLILSTGAANLTKPTTADRPNGIPFHEAVGAYVYDQGSITPKLDGRIKLEGGVPLPPPWVNSTWNPYGN